MKPAIALLLFVTGSLGAQAAMTQLPRVTLLSASGERTWPVGIVGQAVGFHLATARQGVEISARLGNGGGRAYVAAYLMTAVGPGATPAEEIASSRFELPFPHDDWVLLFDPVSLEPGTYWVVIGKPPERTFSSINWFTAEPKGYPASCDVRFAGTQSFTFFADAAEYLPASKFAKKYEPYAFQLEVTALGTPCDAN